MTEKTELSWRTGRRNTTLQDRVVDYVKDVKISGLRFDLRKESRMVDKFERMGMTDFYNEIIGIDDGLTDSQFVSTLIHELLEVLKRNYRIGVESHEDVMRLETAIYALFIDNPKLVEVINEHVQTRNREEDPISNIIEATKISNSKEEPEKGKEEPKEDSISLDG